MMQVQKRYAVLGATAATYPESSCLQLFASLIDKLRETTGRISAAHNSKEQQHKPIKVSIMLADDDNDDREFFAEIVTEIDPVIKVEVANDGEKLMQVLTAPNAVLPDILFLDLNMPGKDGKQCLKEIKSHPDLKDLPVVIYSTSALVQDIKDTHSQGANLYLRKPNSFNNAITLIKKVFSMDLEMMAHQRDIKNFVLLS